MNGLKISVITPVLNGAEYIEMCIRSIMNQTYQNFEHIIMDGGSTDGTVEIVEKYAHLYNVKLCSENDNGMYDAITKGFDLATGDIFCWLNSDDMFMPWAFEVMQKVICETDAQWCMGYPTHWIENNVNRCFFRVSTYTQWAIRNGFHDGRVLPFVQQESTFWTRALWERSNGKKIRDYQMAGDYHLWKTFAEFTPMYIVYSVISGFRCHPGQKSAELDRYYREIGELSKPMAWLAKHRVMNGMDAVVRLFWRKNFIDIERLYQNKDLGGLSNER